MNNEQKLQDMVNFFRTRLFEEEMRHADTLATAQAFKRRVDELEQQVSQLLERERNVQEESLRSPAPAVEPTEE
jgi:hypothetical protein